MGLIKVHSLLTVDQRFSHLKQRKKANPLRVSVTLVAISQPLHVIFLLIPIHRLAFVVHVACVTQGFAFRTSASRFETILARLRVVRARCTGGQGAREFFASKRVNMPTDQMLVSTSDQDETHGGAAVKSGNIQLRRYGSFVLL